MNLSSPIRIPQFLLLAAGLVVPAVAQNITPFQNGQVADANAVNANFESLKTAVITAQSTADGAQSAATSAASVASNAASLASGLANQISVSNGMVGLGTTSPTCNLEVANGLDNNGTVASFKIRSGNTNMLMDGNEIDSFDTSPTGDHVLYLNYNSQGNVYITAGANPGRVGIGTTAPDTRLSVNGGASKPGGGSWSVFSDRRLKHDIEPMSGTLDLVLKLRGYTFEYNDDVVAEGRALGGKQIGLIADEVERVFPDWVTRDDRGMRMVTERATTALMVEALRDLRTEKDAQIGELRDENQHLRARLELLASQMAALQNAVQPLLAK